MRKSVIFAAFILANGAPVSAAELLINGSFEGAPAGNTVLNGGSSAIAGWTTSNQGVEWYTPASFGSRPADGNAAIDLAWFTSNGAPGGGIFQDFATEIGETYAVTFFGATQRSNGRDGTGIIDLLLTGQAMQSFAVNNQASTIGLQDWQRFEVSFTAVDTTTRIEFRNTQNANQHFANLDGVSVQLAGAVPEPATWAMLLAGFGAIGTALRRRTKRASAVRAKMA